MKQYTDEVAEIAPKLNDKLMVLLSVIRSCRDEDIPTIKRLVRMDEAFRARLRAEIPVTGGGDRRGVV